MLYGYACCKRLKKKVTKVRLTIIKMFSTIISLPSSFPVMWKGDGRVVSSGKAVSAWAPELEANPSCI